MHSTYFAKPGDVERKWYVVDAAGQTLGRLATEVATVLRGKHKPTFTPHLDTGDFVIVINAEQIVLTGNKLTQKTYNRHSNYPGGFRQTPYGVLMKTKPEFVIEKAVKGMLPHNRLGRAQGKKLKVYRGPEHPHQAQLPQELAIKG
ncbi:MAG TPA: 50S ribosomal protein L13 [Bacillota bacterium]|nr:50S ribosomal protein L13 [Bacillota bacterium]